MIGNSAGPFEDLLEERRKRLLCLPFRKFVVLVQVMDRVITAGQRRNFLLGVLPRLSLAWATARQQLPLSRAAVALMGAMLVSLCSCETASPTARVDQVGAATPVVLGAGDVVRISFTAAPDYNQAQKIRADGKISLPQVGEVVAAGKTLAQFESELKAVYKEQIKNTDVVVTVGQRLHPSLRHWSRPNSCQIDL